MQATREDFLPVTQKTVCGGGVLPPLCLFTSQGFSGGARGKESPCQCRRRRRRGFDPWVRKIPQRRAWQPTPVFLPGKSHGQRGLVSYSPWGHKESDTTEAT